MKFKKREMTLDSLLPADVELASLGEIGVFSKSSEFTKADIVENGEHSVIWSGRLLGGPLRAKSLHKTNGRTKKVFSTGKEILWAGDAETPDVLATSFSVIEPGVLIATNVYYPDNSVLLPAFGAAAIRTLKYEISRFTKGNTIHHLYAKDLTKLRIPLPSLEIQQQIVAILDAYSEFAELQAERVRLLKLEKDVLLQKIFAPGERFKFNLGEKSFDTAEWLEYCLADATLYQPAGMSKEDLVPNGPHIVYGAGSIIGRSDRYNHEESKLIVSCRASVGSIQFTEPKSWITSNSMVIDTSSSTRKIDERALGLALMKYHWHNIASGTSQLQLTRDGFKRVKVNLPEKLKDQRLISDYFREVDSRIKLEEERLQLLKTQQEVALEQIFSK